MLRVLRNLRRKVFRGSRLTRYLFYAVGEIVLVVIGILIALQINNWNQRRQKDILFNNSLEQLYNSIKLDTESLAFAMEFTSGQITLIDSLLKNPKAFPEDITPNILFYLDEEFDIEIHSLETASLITTLDYDPADEGQREIAKELTSYSSFHSSGRNKSERKLSAFLEQENVPNPKPSFGFSSFNNFNYSDSSFYSKANKEKVAELLRTDEMRSILLTLRAQKEIFVIVDYFTFYEDGISILNRLKAYNPDLKLLYKEVGILGTALPNGWEKSVPMKLIDPEKSLWELDVSLKQGEVKFRTRDSWRTNWGGKTFPSGTTIYFGDNIPVEEGDYRVRLNLLENTYEFIKRQPLLN
ncbi:DUF6090 family protein [Salinimicrobium soli]|uniref:DUF6090 family protein n=1 Tax=Salinimicrobium soli TaxID=1254399 RepID=UPI003AAF2059